MFERKARDYQWPIRKIVMRGEAGVWSGDCTSSGGAGGEPLLGDLGAWPPEAEVLMHTVKSVFVNTKM